MKLLSLVGIKGAANEQAVIDNHRDGIEKFLAWAQKRPHVDHYLSEMISPKRINGRRMITFHGITTLFLRIPIRGFAGLLLYYAPNVDRATMRQAEYDAQDNAGMGYEICFANDTQQLIDKTLSYLAMAPFPVKEAA